MAMSVALNLITCFYISLHLFNLSYSSHPSRLLIGVHPLDEKYYGAELIKCKDGSKSFTRNRLNDDFCDCADGTDEPDEDCNGCGQKTLSEMKSGENQSGPIGTSACPSGKFYCRNMGSTPRYLFSSRVNDHICDCCDGSDEYDGTVVCPNTCIRGGNIVYQRTSYDSVARKTKHVITMDDTTDKPSGLKALVFLQMALVIVLFAFLLYRQRKTRRRNT